jgi:PAS domain S-box-containing protein
MMNSLLTIIVIRSRDDVKDCDIAILETEDEELLQEARRRSKYILISGEKAQDKAEIFSFLSNFELFRSIVERSPDPIVVHDTERILYANPRTKEISGSEGLKLRIADFIHPSFRQLAFQRMQRVLRGDRVGPAEELFILPYDREVWVETNPSLIEFKGRPAILLIMRDLTERKRVKEKYREFFGNSLDIIAITDLEGKFVEVNRAFEEVFGYRREEVLGRNYAELLKLDKETAEKIFRDYNTAFREKRDLRGILFEVKGKDGKRIVVEGNVRLLWEGKKVIGFVGNFRDVTERIELEEKLRESEEKYRKIFENSPVSIALANENGVFIEANPAMVKSIGADPAGKNFYEIFSKEVAERRHENLRKAIERNELVVINDEREGRNFINYYVPLELGGRGHCLIISQEITELLRLNKLLKLMVEANEAVARIRDREKLVRRIEEILSDYSAKVSDEPGEFCFKLSYGGREYGYLCVRVEREEEKRLIQSLAENLAFALKAIEDEKRRKELYERLFENIRTLAYLADGIRNPLAAIRAYSETLVNDEVVREKIISQVERIVEIMRKLDVSWGESEKLWKEETSTQSQE